MMASRLLIGLLALALVLGSGSAVAAESPHEPQRDPADAADLAIAVSAIAAAQGQRAGSTWTGLDEATRSSMVRELDWAKVERERQARRLRADLAEVTGPDQACERDLLRQKHRAADALLAEYVSQLRFARGDRRSGLRKLESRIERHVLQPIGRIAKETIKQSLPELVGMYLSGGTLSKSVIRTVARRNAVRIAKRHAQDLALRALARKVHGVGANTVEQAREVCKEKPEPSASPTTGDVPAIPAGTYVGTLENVEATALVWTDQDSVVETNTFEIEVDEAGAVSGEFEVYETGAHTDPDETIVCDGGSTHSLGTFDPGQRVGASLPQALNATLEYTMVYRITFRIDKGETIHYCNSPQSTTDAFPFPITFTAFSGGTITGDMEGWPFVLAQKP